VNDWTERSIIADASVKAEIKALVATAWRSRWWLIGCVVACTAVAAIVAVCLPRIYRATTVLVPATPTAGLGEGLSSALGSVGALASFAGIDIGGGGKADEIIAVLTSREFIERFIREKNLLPVLYADDWDKSTGTWKAGVRPTSLALAYKYFKRDILSVEKDKTTGLIKLSIDWTDREQAANWANELVARTNAEMRARAMDKADKSVRFLEEESRRTSLVPTQQAIGRLMENQINQRMLANVTDDYALRVVDTALPPDARDPVSPRKVLIVAAGIVGGITLGLFLVWFFAEAPVPVQVRRTS